MHVGTFAVGIDWKYDDHDLDEIKRKSKENKYKNSEYRVHPRYKDLKEEMFNYRELPFGAIDTIIAKAEAYLMTKAAKASFWVRDGTPKIELDTLICIILYTDYSELSRDFTLSFRKTHQFQTLKQVKSKNARYYHWSKTLRDTIKYYGQHAHSHLKGPYFCGMSVMLNLLQFNVHIHSPLSTSVHIEVALKFSGENGMILEMNNNLEFGIYLKALDVSWISRFKEEDERYIYVNLY